MDRGSIPPPPDVQRPAVNTSVSSSSAFPRRQLSPPALVRAILEPAIILGSLFAIAACYEQDIGGQYLILGIILFYLTFPGRTPTATGAFGMAREVLLEWFAILFVVGFLGWATRTAGKFDPNTLVTWAVATPIALFTAHRTLPRLLPRLLLIEGIQRTAVIVGAGDLGRKLSEQIARAPYLGIDMVGYFEDRCRDRTPGVEERQILGRIASVADYVKEHHVDMVYITLPMAAQPRNVKLLDDLRDTTASIYFVPDIFLFDLIQGRMDSVNGMPVVAACESPFYGVNGLVKRVSDILLSLLILTLVSPLLVAIALGVKISSPGPILFKQRRYGVDGREIVVYKFRSMTVLEDGSEIRQATRNDQCITPFGRFLRQRSLDELPQFFNVLQGRMSIVGPRPHAVAHNEQYRKLIKGYMMRHKVKPGITGWAQVNGYRGETADLEKMKARIEFDLDYLRHWSLRLDLMIIFKTIGVVLSDQGAY